MTDAAVGALAIVAADPRCQGASALGGGLIGIGISPLTQAGLNEAFSLAVGAWRVGPGSLVSDALVGEQIAVGEAFLSRTIVRS